MTSCSDILISEKDKHLLNKYHWNIVRPDRNKSKPYVTTRINGKTIYLHRMIMDAPKGKEVDHINGNGLDNRRKNLRIVTRGQNCFNSGFRKKYKGVHLFKYTGTYQAYISKGGKRMHLGYHHTEKEAARAYNQAATKLFGDFARLNDV